MQALYNWQQTQWQQLTGAFQAEHLAHALLFAGPAGIGKTELALRFAEFILCSQRGAQACGYCDNCQLLQAQHHPDLIILQPEKAGATLGIDNVRDLQTRLWQTANRGGYQVVLLLQAEQLTLAASQALLKTLEEPVGKVVIILVSSQPTRLLSTIRSRCQWWRFTIPPVSESVAWLVGQGITQRDAELALRLQYDCPLSAKIFCEQQEVLLQLWLQQFNELLTHQLTPLKLAANWAEQDAISLLDFVYTVLLDLQRLSLGATAEQLMYREQFAVWQQLLSRYSQAHLSQWLKRLQTTKAQLQLVPLNAQLVWESLLTRMLASSR